MIEDAFFDSSTMCIFLAIERDPGTACQSIAIYITTCNRTFDCLLIEDHGIEVKGAGTIKYPVISRRNTKLAALSAMMVM